ncbi:MAG: SIS domain-containing protein [Halioglobus sp.]|nr:SIS domain-containing protein [Halioglobus sp.]
MNFYNTIAGSFQATIEAISLSVDTLAPSIERAVQCMTRCLLDDKKILVCGNGPDAALAQLFAANLLGHHARERPALPAVALAADGAILSAIIRASGSRDIFARQIRALGQTGDVLLCLSSDGSDPTLLRAVQAARERNMTVITLSNSRDEETGALLAANDVELTIDAGSVARVVELQTMVIHCLCELIDLSLFGDYNTEQH